MKIYRNCRSTPVLVVAFLTVSAIWLLGAEPLAAQYRLQARAILDSTGIKGGIVVHLGCGDGRLTAALRASDAYLVRGLDTDKSKVRDARQYIRSQGLYGEVSVAHWGSERLPFVDNLVNLVVIEETESIPMREVMRVLTPGGAASIRKNNEWTVKVKPWPKDIDEWTHWLHGSGNNAVARDGRVGPPQQIQWKSGPEHARSHEQRPTTRVLVSAKGRVFGLIDEGIKGQRAGVPSEWKLVARDAFNGKLLWKRSAARFSQRMLVASGEHVFTPLGNKKRLAVLDAASGETIYTCEGTEKTKEILVTEGIAICRLQAGDIVSIEKESGKILWRKKTGNINGNSLAAKNGRICYTAGGNLVCLGLENGKELWRAEGDGKYVVMLDEIVLLAGNHTEAFSAGTGERLWAGPPSCRSIPGIFVADGLIWSAWTRGGSPFNADWREIAGAHGRPSPGRGLKIWEPKSALRKGYNPATGRVERQVGSERLITPGHHIRCYPPKATEHYLLLNKRGVEFLDLKGDNHMRHNWMRPDCRVGVMPANGLLYLPPHPCFCYPGVLLNGLNAFTSRTNPRLRSSGGTERLFRGPAWNDAGEGGKREKSKKTDDWPTYRHDPVRSGSVSWNGPSALQQRWKTSIEGRLSPPVASAGRLFVAAVGSHAVHCLDVRDGEKLWSYLADARVDSPPTIHNGLVLFGSADGHVYCLRAEDGTLVWKFRAAPDIEQISIRGQIESAWPVHGSVLVRDNKVYAVAGRSSHLDGGVWIYALDPATGKVLHQRRIENTRPDIAKDAGRPFDMEGTRSDILVAGANDIYMFQKRFKPDLTPEPMPRISKLGDRLCERHLICTGGFLDQRWAKGAFNRLFWMYSDRWPGYYFAYEAPKAGQILVFDKDTTYSVKYYYKRHGHSPEFRPRSGYQLFADSNANDPVLGLSRSGQEKGGGFSRGRFWKWRRNIPVRVEAMVLAGKHLYLAGPPDTGSGKKARDSILGKKGARLWTVFAENGKPVSKMELKHAPVFDGLIAAYGQLFMVCKDSSIICFGNRKDILDGSAGKAK